MRWVPIAAKRRLLACGQWLALRRALRSLLELPPGTLPSRPDLLRLSTGWGNPSHAARIDYLLEVLSLAWNGDGPILECGSGLSTLALGATVGAAGREIYSLEHDPAWLRRLEDVVHRHRVPGIRLIDAPLKDYAGYSWYAAPFDDLPASFSMVVCDGPPGGIRGGRYGLLPLMIDRIPRGAPIVLDDVHRPGEQEVLRRWGALTDLEIRHVRSGNDEFVVATRR